MGNIAVNQLSLNIVRLISPEATDKIPQIEWVDYDAFWNDPRFDKIVSFRILNETHALRENERLGEAVDEIILTI